MLRRACCFLFVILLVAQSGTSSSQQNGDLILPKFSKSDCEKFRHDLQYHISISARDRLDSVNLGISSVVLSWIPALPSIALGISAIVLAIRAETDAFRRLVKSGITFRNWHAVNFKCANVVGGSPLQGVEFYGVVTEGINLGIAGIVLSLLALVVSILFFCKFSVELNCCCDGEKDCEDKSQRYVEEVIICQ